MIQIPQAFRLLWKPARYKVYYGGRGAAKSWAFARALLLQASEKPMRVLCAREIQRTIADSVHKLLSDQIEAMGLSDFYQVKDAEITGKNGSQFIFAGIRGQDIGKVKSFEGVDRCWVEEAQVVTKKSWDVLVPTIRKPGSEIWVSFNPELDTDETYQRFVVNPQPDSIVVKVNHDSNPWFPTVLDQEMRALRARDPEAYENVWLGNCRTSVDGAIYAKEIREAIERRRIRAVPYDPVLKVHTVWDLGWNDAMCVIMAQRVASSVSIIDYIETSHKTYAEIVQELGQRKYQWGFDFLPHDGKAKNPQTGKSALEILAALGRQVKEVPDIGVEEGIRAARQLFGQVFFDEEPTKRLVHCLKRYRRAISSATNEPGSPLHDEFSHGADAFRYMAVIANEMVNEKVTIKDPYASLRRAG